MSSPSNENPASAIGGTPLGRFRRGIGLGLPIFLGYVPVGAAFGVLAHSLGFTVAQAFANSAFALAGAGQFIGLSLLQGGSDVVGVLAATAVVNLRYVLFSSTMSPYLRDVPLGKQAWLAFSLTDETFAVNISDRKQGLATVESMAGVGAIAWLGWVAGTLLGVVGAGWIGDPSRWGVQFAMPAMFTALFIALADDWRHVVTGVVAGALALAMPLLGSIGVPLGPSWYLIVASMVAASVAAVVWRE